MLNDTAALQLTIVFVTISSAKLDWEVSSAKLIRFLPASLTMAYREWLIKNEHEHIEYNLTKYQSFLILFI